MPTAMEADTVTAPHTITEQELAEFRGNPVVQRIKAMLAHEVQSSAESLAHVILDTPEGFAQAKACQQRIASANRFISFVDQELRIDNGEQTHDAAVQQPY